MNRNARDHAGAIFASVLVASLVPFAAGCMRSRGSGQPPPETALDARGQSEQLAREADQVSRQALRAAEHQAKALRRAQRFEQRAREREQSAHDHEGQARRDIERAQRLHQQAEAERQRAFQLRDEAARLRAQADQIEIDARRQELAASSQEFERDAMSIQPPPGAQPYGAQPYGAQPYGAQPYDAQPYGLEEGRPRLEGPRAQGSVPEDLGPMPGAPGQRLELTPPGGGGQPPSASPGAGPLSGLQGEPQETWGGTGEQNQGLAAPPPGGPGEGPESTPPEADEPRARGSIVQVEEFEGDPDAYAGARVEGEARVAEVISDRAFVLEDEDGRRVLAVVRDEAPPPADLPIEEGRRIAFQGDALGPEDRAQLARALRDSAERRALAREPASIEVGWNDVEVVGPPPSR